MTNPSALPGVFSDYTAPTVRDIAEGREIVRDADANSVPPAIANLEFSRKTQRELWLIVAILQGVYAIAPGLFSLFRELWSDQIIFTASVAIQLSAIIAYLLGAGRAAPRCDRSDGNRRRPLAAISAARVGYSRRRFPGCMECYATTAVLCLSEH